MQDQTSPFVLGRCRQVGLSNFFTALRSTCGRSLCSQKSTITRKFLSTLPSRQIIRLLDLSGAIIRGFGQIGTWYPANRLMGSIVAQHWWGYFYHGVGLSGVQGEKFQRRSGMSCNQPRVGLDNSSIRAKT